MTTEQKETFLDLLVDNSMTQADQVSLIANTLQIRALYIFNKRNRLEIPAMVSSLKGTTKALALVDSGTMENFLNHPEAKRLKLGAEKLDNLIQLRNVDETYNHTGKIIHFTNLVISYRNKVSECFYISGLSGIGMILRYPWLCDFNPQINWPLNKLIGPSVKMATTLYTKYPSLHDCLKEW